MARRVGRAWVAIGLVAGLVAACGRGTAGEEGELMKTGLEALYTANDPATAIGHFRQVLALNPEHYGATYQLATALDRAGRPDEARPLWEKVAAMAAGYQDQQTLQTARSRLAAPGAAPGSPEALMQEGLNLLRLQKDPAAAAERFRRILDLNPDHYGATYQLAAALQQAGRLDEARPYWTKALEMARGYKDEKTIQLIESHLAVAKARGGR